MKSKKQLFEEAPVLNAVLSLALPSIMGQVILVIYNIADTLFVSFSGSDEMITAVTVCMPAFMFLSAISNLFGVGGASVISRALGSNRKEKAKQVSAFSIWGCIVVTVLYCSFAGLFLSLFVDLLGGSAPGVHENACAYLKVAVVAGGLGAALSTLMAHLLRTGGSSCNSDIQCDCCCLLCNSSPRQKRQSGNRLKAMQTNAGRQHTKISSCRRDSRLSDDSV